LRYTATKSKPAKQDSVKRWNLSGAFMSPNIMTVHSNTPKGVMIAVLYSSPSAMRTWWYPECKSSFEKHLVFCFFQVQQICHFSKIQHCY
jgi:hypothetical protein